MKYFRNEDERKASNSTCYHEFFKGEWNDNTPVFWKTDSLNIHDDVMSMLQLDALISSVVPGYDPYGVTKINEKQWNAICLRAKAIGGDLLEAICELTPWVEDNYRQHKVFTILGL